MSCCLEFIIPMFFFDTSIISLILCTCNNLQTIVMSLNHRKQYIYCIHNYNHFIIIKSIYICINIYLFYFENICCIECIHMTLQLHLPRSPTLGPYLVLGGRACYESWRKRSWARRARNNNGWWIYCNIYICIYTIYIYIYYIHIPWEPQNHEN